MKSVGPTLKIWLFHWLCGYWQQQHTNNNFINLDLYWLLILYSTFPEDKDYSWLFLSAFLKNHKSKSNYPFFCNFTNVGSKKSRQKGNKAFKCNKTKCFEHFVLSPKYLIEEMSYFYRSCLKISTWCFELQ